MKESQKKFLSWLKVILWMAVIFYFSSQPDLKSSLPNDWDFIFRKIAHMSEYFVLAYLSVSALKNYKLSFKIKMILAAFISVGYAVMDELHQNFVVGRYGSMVDVLIDASGVAIAILLLILYNKNK